MKYKIIAQLIAEQRRHTPSMWLLPSEITNSNHPDIIEMANELVRGARDDYDKTIRILTFLRQNIKYHFTPWDTSASQTLALKHGMCANRMNLAVALFRATNIPSRLVMVRYKKEALQFRILQSFFPFVSDTIRHCRAQVRLDNQWIHVDIEEPIQEDYVMATIPLEFYPNMEAFLHSRQKQGQGLGSNPIFHELNKAWLEKVNNGEPPRYRFYPTKVLQLVGEAEAMLVAAIFETLMVKDIQIMYTNQADDIEMQSKLDKARKQGVSLVVMIMKEANHLESINYDRRIRIQEEATMGRYWKEAELILDQMAE